MSENKVRRPGSGEVGGVEVRKMLRERARGEKKEREAEVGRKEGRGNGEGRGSVDLLAD